MMVGGRESRMAAKYMRKRVYVKTFIDFTCE